MKLVEANGQTFIFELSERERELLGAILKFYPLLNADYHRLTKGKANAKKIEESQALLVEAMAEQKAAGKRAVAEFLSEANWPPAGNAFRLTLSAEKMEWFLQVLNDVRVGSWVKLGKPDPQRGTEPEAKIENLPYLGAMELSGWFQSVLLSALES